METPATDTSKKSYLIDSEEDITLDEDWINEQIDRLIAWELMTRGLTLNTEEVPPEKLCDMIGVPKNYVFEVIKKISTRCQKTSPTH
jgi:hypothetical protein